MNHRHIIRGRTVAQWADHFGLTIGRIYQLIYAGGLESRIDGTWRPKPTIKVGAVHYGLTLAAWAERLGIASCTAHDLLRSGRLQRIAAGEKFERGDSRGKPYAGMSRQEIAERLGLTSRERVRQLICDGKVDARLEGRDLKAEWVAKVRSGSASTHADVYSPAKTIREMAEAAGCGAPAMREWLHKQGLPYRAGQRGRPKKNRTGLDTAEKEGRS